MRLEASEEETAIICGDLGTEFPPGRRNPAIRRMFLRQRAVETLLSLRE